MSPHEVRIGLVCKTVIEGDLVEVLVVGVSYRRRRLMWRLQRTANGRPHTMHWPGRRIPKPRAASQLVPHRVEQP